MAAGACSPRRHAWLSLLPTARRSTRPSACMSLPARTSPHCTLCSAVHVSLHLPNSLVPVLIASSAQQYMCHFTSPTLWYQSSLHPLLSSTCVASPPQLSGTSPHHTLCSAVHVSNYLSTFVVLTVRGSLAWCEACTPPMHLVFLLFQSR